DLLRPDGEAIRWKLDDLDNVLELTPPGSEPHVFTYADDTKLLSSSTPPAIEGAESATELSIGQRHYRYSDDLLLERIERSDGRELRLDFELESGRLATLGLERGALDFEYEPQSGELESITTPEGNQLEYSFDGPLWLGTTWTGAVSGSVSADYDENLWLSELSVTAGSQSSVVGFTHDDDGLLLLAGELALSRDATTGLVTGASIGSINSSFAHNAFGELISLRTDAAEGALLSQGLSQILSQVLSRDRLGRITALTETVAGETRELSFEYDSVGRLIEATDEGVVTRYEYDPNGNRTELTSDGREVRAEYDAQDRIQSHGGLQFEQTAEGDLIRKSDGARALELAYDELGSLLSAMVSEGLVTTEIAYVVDGAGRRIGKQ